MLTQLYSQFRVLYAALLDKHPNLPSEHAQLQEHDIHEKTNKTAYRNAVITSLASLKRRIPPDSLQHPSVGTDSQIAARKAEQDSVQAVQLTPSLLEPLIPTKDQLVALGYLTELPADWGPGGDDPTAANKQLTCDRCKTEYVVKDDFDRTECSYHYGRVYSTVQSGRKTRLHSCCGEMAPGPTCSVGPHVFYETDSAKLHSRHAFSPSEPDDTGVALDIVGMDCLSLFTWPSLRYLLVFRRNGVHHRWNASCPRISRRCGWKHRLRRNGANGSRRGSRVSIF